MKRNGILNADISRVLSYMGHTDTICIGDCGLPIPEEVERIDLALKFGEPKFIDVLEEVLKDMKVEKIVLAEEIRDQNPEQLEAIRNLFERYEKGFDAIEFVPHAELKRQTLDCRAVIRSGETTPYSNIILQSGCIFA
ncbi:ribose transport protein RbsD [[Clostridium] aminophilum]|uniref:D-ribose pyranase n=1 Tax=[Clostridium] aminophilum TaxID=1526 RepID=A0A1I0DU06_9FIRM|nr:D-ribose pyranase [[Clostridium] aminophilum]SET35959.1 ribose transport protein RbsD [[Clostridium] aminophilum]